MKRKELAPGMAVEVRSGQPGSPITSYYPAVVVDLGRWRKAHRWAFAKYEPDPNGFGPNKAVAVAVQRGSMVDDRGVWVPDLVQPGQLVPAGTGDVERARITAEREAQRARDEQRREALEAEKAELDGRLAALGVLPSTMSGGVHWNPSGGLVEMRPDVFRRLLDLAEQAPDGPCGTCADRGTVPATGRGSDGYDPCPVCTEED